ncbi:carbonic anhydrase [Pelosinus sp. IPA-1]|uniref:carbonic anhydrase n=1 Tax=Pelosinus sp. IPA-1 TaxID=3029569 RepID=UPI00243617B6|nr:carbonic anhydrase [Pelosinus sp. IPA-1]GMA98130.1 carbonic anhydrase [Pelosinus sp. IPA-1]
MNAEHALRRLIGGNERYVTENFAVIDVGVERREELVEEGQYPFAVVVSCSDSRVPPEIVFDQGLGDLFVVRTAGEVVDDIALGSVEYAIEHLGVKLIVVLGHEGCGAVRAAVEDSDEPGHIALIIETIKPAVEKAKMQQGDLLENAIKENVDLNICRLKASRLIRTAMLTDCLEIIGAIYDMYDGYIEFWY